MTKDDCIARIEKMEQLMDRCCDAYTLLEQALCRYEETEQAMAQSLTIKERIDALPQEQRQYFLVETGRLKFKSLGSSTRKQRAVRDSCEEVRQIDTMIQSYHERIRFIGKIKKYKEDHKL